jgi:hypothetical protein
MYAGTAMLHFASDAHNRAFAILVRLLDLGQIVEGRVKCSCSGFGAVLDDERKVAGKRTYFTAVVVVFM